MWNKPKTVLLYSNGKIHWLQVQYSKTSILNLTALFSKTPCGHKCILDTSQEICFLLRVVTAPLDVVTHNLGYCTLSFLKFNSRFRINRIHYMELETGHRSCPSAYAVLTWPGCACFEKPIA